MLVLFCGGLQTRDPVRFSLGGQKADYKSYKDSCLFWVEASKASLLKDAVRKCEGREKKDSESVLCKKGVIKPLSLLSFNGKAV